MKKLLLLTSITFLSLTSTQHANAAGFYIQEQSVKGLGAAFSGSVTSLNDASTIYFNPAAMTRLDGMQINAGAHVITVHADLDNTGTTVPFGGSTNVDPGNPYDPEVIPNFYFATPIHGKSIWFGLGVSAPFGLANDYGETWFGRFDSTETELTTIDVQPTIAIQAADWLSVGLGINIQYADATLRSVANPAAVSEGISSLEGDDISYGYTASLMATPIEKLDIGISYRSGISHRLDGTIELAGTGVGEFNSNGSADLDLPDVATFGLGYDINDSLRVMAQATWFGWNNFQDITAVRNDGAVLSQVLQNYQTTWAFAVGAEYDVNEKWTVRGGYQFDETPTTDGFRSTRTPDGDRNWFSAGASYKINNKLEMDFATTYIDVSDERINVTRTTGAGTSNIQADSSGTVGIFAVGLNYKF